MRRGWRLGKRCRSQCVPDIARPCFVRKHAGAAHLTLQSALVHFAIEVIKRTSIASMAIYVLVSPTKVSSSFVDAITRAIIRAIHRVQKVAVPVNFDRHMALCCISTLTKSSLPLETQCTSERSRLLSVALEKVSERISPCLQKHRNQMLE